MSKPDADGQHGEDRRARASRPGRIEVAVLSRDPVQSNHDERSAASTGAEGTAGLPLGPSTASIRLDRRHQALARTATSPSHDLSPEVAEGEVCVLLGPVGLRQDDDDEDDQPPGRADVGPHPRRRRATWPSVDPVELRRAHRLRDPAGRAVPPPDRRRQRRHRAPAARAGTRRRTSARVDELLALVDLDPADVPRPLSPPALRRPAPAGRRGPGPGRRPAGAADGRAFGALDPVTRARLQDEFRRLQDELAQDRGLRDPRPRRGREARRPDRGAGRGGVLEQYDTPAAVLGRPASPFVAVFVGADRAVKRLAVLTLAEEAVEPWSGPPPPRRPWPSGPACATCWPSCCWPPRVGWASPTPTAVLRAWCRPRVCSAPPAARPEPLSAGLPRLVSPPRGMHRLGGASALPLRTFLAGER